MREIKECMEEIKMSNVGSNRSEGEKDAEEEKFNEASEARQDDY